MSWLWHFRYGGGCTHSLIEEECNINGPASIDHAHLAYHYIVSILCVQVNVIYLSILTTDCMFLIFCC